MLMYKLLKKFSVMSIPQIESIESILCENLNKNKKIVHKKVTRLDTSEWGGNMLKIDLTVKDESIYTQEEFSIIAKVIPGQDVVERDSLLGFNKEVAFYENVAPMLQNFQRNNGKEDVINCFPEFLGAKVHNTHNDKNNYGISFMRDLSLEGYRNVSRYTGFDLQTSKIVLKALAKFHGIPLALKLTEPDIFNEELEPRLMGNIDDSINESDVSTIFNILKECADLAPHMQKIKEYLSLECCKVKTLFWTLSHGELWIKNIMVRYENGNPIETKFLDFRNYSHDTVAKDLIFFFITSVQFQTLKENLDDLLQYYHEHFTETLKAFEVGDLEIFSYVHFLKEITINTGFTFLSAISVLINQIVEDSAEFCDRTSGGSLVCRKKIPLKVKEKVWWVVEEFIKRDWLSL